MESTVAERLVDSLISYKHKNQQIASNGLSATIQTQLNIMNKPGTLWFIEILVNK